MSDTITWRQCVCTEFRHYQCTESVDLAVSCFFPRLYLSLNCEGCWGSTDDFTTSFLHFYLSSFAQWEGVKGLPIIWIFSAGVYWVGGCWGSAGWLESRGSEVCWVSPVAQQAHLKFPGYPALWGLPVIWMCSAGVYLARCLGFADNWGLLNIQFSSVGGRLRFAASCYRAFAWAPWSCKRDES